MNYIGIDPGLAGAVAIIRDGDIHGMLMSYQVRSMPHIASMVHAPELSRLLQELCASTDSQLWIEQAQSMPGQGVASTFAYGTGYGIILGIAASLGIPYTLVRPAVWKRKMGVTKDKTSSTLRALQLFPGAGLTKTSDHGKAEALLIAWYGKHYGGGV